jgi:hypothetical protein
MEVWKDVDENVTLKVNVLPLIDDTDFKSIETGIAYNETGMSLIWNFVETSASSPSQTQIIPTSGGNYDWSHEGNGIYLIEIPASGGASVNNDTEGFGWFTGVCDGILPWRSPIYGFRSINLNTDLVNSGSSIAKQISVASILEDTETTIPALIASIDTDVLDATVEGGYSVQDILRIMVAILAGKVSGGATSSITYRDLSDTMNLVIATVDTVGNRTNVTTNT